MSVRDVGVDVLVDIPRGSRNKYEDDAASGRIRLEPREGSLEGQDHQEAGQHLRALEQDS